MYDKKIFKETFSTIKASEGTLMEVLNMRNNKKIRNKRTVIVLATAIMLMVFTVTALAYSGMLGWIFTDRDDETKQLGETAQDALNSFTDSEANAENQAQASATDEDDRQETRARNAVSWLAGQLKNSSLSEIKLSDYAMAEDDGAITFYFSPGDDPLYERSIDVRVSADGDVTGIDLRAAQPYPIPENCPDEYIVRLTHLSSGIEYEHFNRDAYLLEVAFPDTTLYAPQAEAAAIIAMEQLYENGFIAANPSEIELVYFESFNGGAAWIDVLMENGDVCCLYLQPYDFGVMGFDYRTKARIDAGNGNAPLYEALRNGTIEEYQRRQEKLYAISVG